MTPTDKPMTVDALIENTRLAWYLGQRYWQQADSESYAENRRSDLTIEKFNKLLESSRAAIEQYGREQGFESTAQRDVREACYELRDALGNPVISGTGDQTIQGQTIRMAAARLRGSGEPARRWPLVETPGQFAERMREALRDFGGDMLAACRYCLIESPPTIARHQSREPLTDEQILRLWTGDSTTSLRPVIGAKKVISFARAIERAHDIRSAG